MAELDALVDLGRRGPGSDAERRTAQHLQDRLETLGRAAETEQLAIYPAWPIAYALLAAAAVGADGIIVEIHPSPEDAICDAAQQLDAHDFERYAGKVEQAAAVAGKSISVAA